MQTTPAISSSQQQAKRIIKKYKNLKTKKKYAGYKNAKKIKDDDFLSRSRFTPAKGKQTRMNKQDEKDVEFIKRVPLHPRQRLIRDTEKLKHPRDKLKKKEL